MGYVTESLACGKGLYSKFDWRFPLQLDPDVVERIDRRLAGCGSCLLRWLREIVVATVSRVSRTAGVLPTSEPPHVYAELWVCDIDAILPGRLSNLRLFCQLRGRLGFPATSLGWRAPSY